MEKNNKHLTVGVVGENIATTFLQKKGFIILERNVYRKCGELDIVAQHKKTRRVHVVEVKTVSGSKDSAHTNPAENLTYSKMKKLERTATSYAHQYDIQEWQLDAVLVWYDKMSQKAQVEYIQNVHM